MCGDAQRPIAYSWAGDTSACYDQHNHCKGIAIALLLIVLRVESVVVIGTRKQFEVTSMYKLFLS